METLPILIKYGEGHDPLVISDQINALVTRQVINLLRVSLLAGVLFVKLNFLGHRHALLREPENVPVDYKAVLVSQHVEVVREDQACDHVNCVVRPQGDHHHELHEHGRQGEVAPIVPVNFAELEVLNHAHANMTGVKKVCSFSVWHENAHYSRVAPVVALGVLDEPNVLNGEPEPIEHHLGQDHSPGVADAPPSEHAHQHHDVHHKAAHDQQCISVLNVAQEKLI